ncbi:MAG: cytochrome C, partial [Deltaproteobacteria bacterium]|nr:cytochrome C [Deltaproteobacteria bacterium]
MKMVRIFRFTPLLLVGLFVFGFSVGTPRDTWAAAALTAADCEKCHVKEPGEIAAKGQKHKTEINCQDCHTDHRPKVAKNIPECSNCHSGKPHYEVQGCKTCHNPHMPLEIALKGELKEVCLTCHKGPSEAMAAGPSKHAALACNFCHAEKHGVIPACLKCHKPHSATMAQGDCGTCHKAHKPLELAYGDKTASTLCAACHDDAFALLSASKTKHRTVPCVQCHAQKHKTIPRCSDCHGMPHAPGMHQKFPKCGDCHNIAHDLN